MVQLRDEVVHVKHSIVSVLQLLIVIIQVSGLSQHQYTRRLPQLPNVLVVHLQKGQTNPYLLLIVVSLVTT